jgi:hypothetical protein
MTTAVSIAFNGALLGCIQTSFAAEKPGDASHMVWNRLRMGLVYGAAPEKTPELVQKIRGVRDVAFQAAVRILYMPVFEGQDADLNFLVSYDPFNTQDAGRTHVQFDVQKQPAQVLPSFLRTTRGYRVRLETKDANGNIPASRFAFGKTPARAERGTDQFEYHLSPDGAFNVSIYIPKQGLSNASLQIVSKQLLLGLSGMEYVEVNDHAAVSLVFAPGRSAYLPLSDASNTGEGFVGLTDFATTSYLTIVPNAITAAADVPVYFAQSLEAPMYSGGITELEQSDNVLNFNPIPLYTLEGNEHDIPKVVPMGVYAGLNGEDTELARMMENSTLAPVRHQMYSAYYGHQLELQRKGEKMVKRTRAQDDPLGVTPQGMIAELTADHQDYEGLIIGNMPGTSYPTVDFTMVEGKFKESILNNQLFFVAANVDEFMKGTSVRYELTDSDYELLKVQGVPLATIEAVQAAVGQPNRRFETEDEFLAVIQEPSGAYTANFLDVGGILKVDIDDWVFQLSPRSWRTDAYSPTMLIAKFCNRTLREMVQDYGSWSWKEVASINGDNSVAQKLLLESFELAALAEAGSPYAIYYKNIVDNPNWNGFLFVNAPVDIAEMPQDLRFLTAGIDLDRFYAHHIGFSQTPFTMSGGQPVLDRTSVFGLIDYVDTLDLYTDVSIALGFKTMQLRARFANAALADFSAQVELMINDLLGSLMTKQESTRGNNLIIDGSYQRVGGLPCYAFTLTGENLFSTAGTILSSFEVLSVQLVSGGSTLNTEVLTSFNLMGNIRFQTTGEFDLFSFGPDNDGTDGFLRFNNLGIDMSFDLLKPRELTFKTREADTRFDLPNSVYRKGSLAGNFPMVASTLVGSPNLSGNPEEPTGQTPEDMGFTSISMPLDQSRMKPSWFGLIYTLDLGTLGALTGNASIKVTFVAAWSRLSEGSSAPIFLGLKLPNMPAIGGSFPLQGVLKLGFKAFLFENFYDDKNQLSYMLRMRQFALSILIWSFPPGNNDILLFGKPGDPKASLGWYVAYAADSKPSPPPKAKALRAAEKEAEPENLDRVQRRLRSGRRTPPLK